MKHLINVKTTKISWLKDWNPTKLGGVISDLYYPESIDELVEIVKVCQDNKREFYVFGHTSNSYLLPSFSPDVVISILYLNGYTETEEAITTECGVHSKWLAKYMVGCGYKGFEGLIDLPGTVSGAIYGNAGCYGCLISDYLLSVLVLNKRGQLVEFKKSELGFDHRSSKFKTGEIRGTIIKATFSKVEGDKELLKEKAKLNHANRLETQPGPSNNLGTIFLKDEYTIFGNWIRRIGRYFAKMLHKPENAPIILKFKLLLAGYPKLSKYLSGMDRFIWNDENAHVAFEDFLQMRKKLFKHNRLEIEIFK